jgi:hypothetical protein
MKNYAKYMVLSILFFSTVSIIFRLAIIDNPDFNIQDLSLNLLSEIAGMVFTVVVFNEFISHRQSMANYAKSKLLVAELEEFLSEMDFTFRTAAEKSSMDKSDDNVWSKEYIETIRENIVVTDVDDSTFPAVPWFLFFAMQGEKLLNKCENIRTQYQEILNPSVSDFFFYLLNDSEMLNDLSNIKKIYEVDLLTNYERPLNLSSYFACPTEKDFAKINWFKDWLVNEKKRLTVSDKAGSRFKKAIQIFCPVLFFAVALNYVFSGNYYFACFYGIITIVFLLAVVFRNRKRKH